MKSIYKLLFITAALGLSACEDVVDIELEQGSTLVVVDGMITNELKPQKVRLTTTAPYFENQATPSISNAFVEIKEYDESGILLQVDTLIEDAMIKGDYYCQKITNGVIGRRYDLTVRALGETYTASSTMQRIPPIDSVTFKYETYSIPELTGYHAYYHGPEIPGLGDNYLFRIYRNGKLYDNPNQIYFASDELVDGNYIGNVDITPEVFELGDTIKVESYTTSRDQYFFLVEMSKQVNNGGIFANPPANLRTNISNVNPSGKKAVGYFSANAMNSMTGIVK